MSAATFIIAENNDLCRLGLERIIQDQFQSPVISFVSTKLELHSSLLQNSGAVVIVDFDSLSINTIDELTVLSACFPQSGWLFVGDIPDETFLMPLTATFGKANFVLKTNEYNVIATAILATDYFGKSEPLLRQSEPPAKVGWICM
jgi:DNA-binding NarL/FixJ family response regulator